MSLTYLEKILIVDVESTCWKTTKDVPLKEKSEIIEIGIVQLNLKSLELEKSTSILVKPIKSKVSQFCTELTTLTQQQVDNGVSFAEACDFIKNEYLAYQKVWFSWGNYDKKMFKKQCEDEAYKATYPFGPNHYNLKSMFALLMGLDKEVGLKEACSLLKLPFDGTLHRGIDDARNIGKLYAEMCKGMRPPVVSAVEKA